jgi:hypothetical protein
LIRRQRSPEIQVREARPLDDEDLASVVVYLRSVPPVRNALPPTRAAVSASQLDRLAGRHRAEGSGITLHVRRDGARLLAREDEADEIELIPQSELRFLAPGWPTPLDFVLGATGGVSRVDMLGLDRMPFVRASGRPD